MLSATPKAAVFVVVHQDDQCSTTVKHVDLAAVLSKAADFINPAVQNVLTSSLGSSSEDVKAVASQALGGVAIGNLSTYLPFILKQIQSQVSCQSLVANAGIQLIRLEAPDVSTCMSASMCTLSACWSSIVMPAVCVCCLHTAVKLNGCL